MLLFACALILLGCSEKDRCWERVSELEGTRTDHLDWTDGAWLGVEDGVEVIWRLAPVDSAKAVWVGPEDLLDDASLAFVADTLQLWDGNACRWLRRPDLHLTCSLFTPTPSGIHLQGHGRFESRDTLSPPVHFTILGSRSSAVVDVLLQADSLAVHVPSGAMTMSIRGEVRRAGAYLSGLSQLDAAGLITEHFQLHAATNRRHDIHASTYAYVAMAGSGDVWVFGRPNQLDTEDLGGSGELVLGP